MDNPKETTALAQYRTRGAFTVSAVAADPETSGMEADFAAAQATVKQLGRDEEDLEEELEKLEAKHGARDRTADGIFKRFELRLFGVVDKKRDDRRYRRYIPPEGLRAVTEAEPRKLEPKLIRSCLKALEEDKNDPDFTPLYAEFFEPLLAAVQAVEASDAAWTKAEEQLEYLTDKTIPAAKTNWVEKRIHLHAALTQKFPHDPARVESYFRSFARPRKKKTAAAAAPAPTPTAAPATAPAPTDTKPDGTDK